MMKITKNTAALTTVYIILLLIIPATITLLSVIDAGDLVIHNPDPTPFGYTVSLSLFVFPVLALAIWFIRHPHITIPKSAVKITLLILIPLGVVLDILFGTTFFNFTNKSATLGLDVPVVGGEVPIEEFVFYIFGFALVLLLYVWCDEYWLSAYNVSDYSNASAKVDRIVKFHPFSLLVGAALLTGAILYKKLVAHDSQGFPWYFTYLIMAAIIPSCGLYPTVKKFVNWRAFAFTCVIMLLISLLWEVTLALPYGWWGFNSQAMMGIHIKAWHQLPIEEVVVWLSVSFTSVFIYEAVKIWRASGKSLKVMIMGR